MKFKLSVLTLKRELITTLMRNYKKRGSQMFKSSKSTLKSMALDYLIYGKSRKIPLNKEEEIFCSKTQLMVFSDLSQTIIFHSDLIKICVVIFLKVIIPKLNFDY